MDESRADQGGEKKEKTQPETINQALSRGLPVPCTLHLAIGGTSRRKVYGEFLFLRDFVCEESRKHRAWSPSTLTCYSQLLLFREPLKASILLSRNKQSPTPEWDTFCFLGIPGVYVSLTLSPLVFSLLYVSSHHFCRSFEALVDGHPSPVLCF